MKRAIAMQKLNINEIFYSLQGEGIRAGTPNIFIRLCGCNLNCSFCDTEHNSINYQLTIFELYQNIIKYNCNNIIWSGGEPTLQLNFGIIEYFKDLGFFQSIETNGTNEMPNNIDFITVSPKLLIKQPNVNINELKYIINKDSNIPNYNLKADYYFLSPEFKNDKLNYENLDRCIELIKENQKWRLTIQSHKIWKVQ